MNDSTDGKKKKTPRDSLLTSHIRHVLALQVSYLLLIINPSVCFKRRKSFIKFFFPKMLIGGNFAPKTRWSSCLTCRLTALHTPPPSPELRGDGERLFERRLPIHTDHTLG